MANIMAWNFPFLSCIGVLMLFLVVINTSPFFRVLWHCVSLNSALQQLPVKGNITPRLMTEEFAATFRLGLSREFKCHRPVRLGTTADGGWSICLDGLLPKLRSHQLASQGSGNAAECLVYAFGVGNPPETSFDFAIEALGCSVFMFDPTIGRPRQDLSPNLHFRPIGIGVRDESRSNVFEFRTLDSIAELLGHTNSIIDVLKIDVEGDEWKVLPTLFASKWLKQGKVRQLVLEVHFRPHRVDVSEDISSLIQLNDLGYHLWNREENWRYSSPIRIGAHSMFRCLELSYVFVGPSVEGGHSPPEVAPPPGWKFISSARGF
jgi:hypothetical protein